jgi:hypothetical protein
VIAHDITKTNHAVRELIARTENPRHRFLLMSYDRHRNLEMAGRYQELFAPDMMVPEPVYHLHAHGTRLTLEGAEAVRSLYRMWAATNQAVFYVDSEQLAVADTFIASVAVGYQQVSGRSLFFDKVLPYLPGFLSRRLVKRALAAETFKVDQNAMYLYKNTFQMIWPYDDRGRLMGEDVYEPHPGQAEITKLDPADVLTTHEAARLLAPLIKPLPSFDARVLGKARASRAS